MHGHMVMVIHTKLVIFISVILVSCGKNNSQDTFSIKDKFLSNQKVEIFWDDILAYNFIDTDDDGTVDRYDYDIDNDGVLNLLDLAPFDKTVWGEDKNQNGITDFLDFRFKEDKTEREAECQEDLLREKQIVYVEDDVDLSEAHTLSVCNIFLQTSMKNIPFRHLKVIAARDYRDSNFGEYGDYDRYWYSANLFIDSMMTGHLSKFNTTLVHEAFHSLEIDNYKLFMEMTSKDFRYSISQQAEIDDHEYFAEAFSSIYLYYENIEYDVLRYEEQEIFIMSPLGEEIKNILKIK